MVTTARHAQVATDEKIRLSGSQRKTAHAIRVNTERQIEEDGLNRTGFLTLTVGDAGAFGFEKVKDSREASKRVHRLMRRFLPSIFRRGVIVTERHRDGGIHFHIIGTLTEDLDIRTGFNFEAVKNGDYRSASPELRAIWQRCREELPAFGFGRAELLPIRKTGAQAASYISKYVEKHIGNRIEDDKGKKLVRYFGWGKRHLKPNDFGWATARAGAWRISARGLSSLVGVAQRSEAAACFGPRWAFRITRVMNACAGNAEVECSPELGNFALRQTARQLVLREAGHRWVERRARENMRDPAAFRWKWIYRSPGERAQLLIEATKPNPCQHSSP